MKTFFYTAPEHRGYCVDHAKRNCKACKRAEEKSFDYGVFEWRPDGSYPRARAIEVFASRTKAEKFIDKHDGNLVVRAVDKIENGA
jgi:hypothetical protein